MSGKDSATSKHSAAIQKFASGRSFMLLLSSDEIRRERLIAELQASLFIERSAIDVIRASELSLRRLQELKDRLLTSSLFSSRLLFHVKEVQELPDTLHAEFSRIIPALPSSNFLLCSGSSLKRASPLYKHALKCEAIFEMPELNDREILSWTREELKRAGLGMSNPAVIETIIVLGESRPDLIYRIIDKLALYLEQGATLTDSDIESLFPIDAPATEFALVDAIFEGDTIKMEKLLEKLLALGKSEFAIHGLLVSTVLRYLRVRIYLDQKMPAPLIQKELNIQPWLFKRTLGSVSKLSASKLRLGLEQLLIAESRLKGHSLDAETILSELSAGLSK